MLEETPFYAESGGQVGDKGVITNKDFKLNIFDTVKSAENIIHRSKDFDEEILNETQQLNADLNNDQIINVLDIVEILNIIL